MKELDVFINLIFSTYTTAYASKPAISRTRRIVFLHILDTSLTVACMLCFVSVFLHSSEVAHLIPLVSRILFLSNHIGGGAALSQYFDRFKTGGLRWLTNAIFITFGILFGGLEFCSAKSSQGGIASLLFLSSYRTIFLRWILVTGPALNTPRHFFSLRILKMGRFTWLPPDWRKRCTKARFRLRSGEWGVGKSDFRKEGSEDLGSF